MSIRASQARSWPLREARSRASEGLPPLNTWLYVIEAEDGGSQQTDVPEYNLVARMAEAEGRIRLRSPMEETFRRRI